MKISHKTSFLSIVLLCAGIFSHWHCDSEPVYNQISVDTSARIIDKASAEKICNAIKNDKHIFYANKIITHDLDFTSAVNNRYIESLSSIRSDIHSSITFINCIFIGKVTAFQKKDNINHFLHFKKNVSFIKCQFRDTINFSDATIYGNAFFGHSIFNEKAIFEGIAFKGNEIFFGESTFKKDVRFPRCVFYGSVSFMRTWFKENADFQNTIFHRDAQFGVTTFNKYAGFSLTRFLSDGYFNYCKFKGKAIFNNSAFDGRCEFMDCTFDNQTGFKRITFNGKTTFSNSDFNGNTTFKQAIFLLGIPDTTQIKIKPGIEWNTDETRFLELQNLVF